MNKIITLLLVSIILLSVSGIQAQNSTTIPVDPRVKHGVLENGMAYYVLHNEEPKDRASFYFVQNVGAILEEDDQNGLAHFLEHMAFNGLKNFPGKNMIDYLEKEGILFGRDINAYTAQDQTVYNVSNVPVANPNVLDSVLLVLHDWSGGLLLEGNEIENERGVIHEEWRTRRNVSKRLNDQSSSILFNNSKYAVRDVIGELEVIDNFEHSALRGYYEKWYRPDLQAVVVVGDIDAKEMEAKIKALFSKIPLKENAAERPYYHVEDSKELGYVVAKDKEAKNPSIMWLFRRDIAKVNNEETRRQDLIRNMFTSMLNSRLSEKTKKLECPALGMGFGQFELTRTKAGDYMYISPKLGKELEAFKEILTELRRVDLHGFTKTELDRTKVQLQRSYESYYANRDKIANDKLAKRLGDLYLKASPFPAIEWEMEFAAKTIPSISLEEVNAQIKAYSNINNSAIIITGPDNAEQYYPGKEELLAVASQLKSLEIEAYKDDAGDTPLVTKELKEVAIAEEFDIERFDAHGYILENGAKVVILPTEYSKDKISLSAFSFGGRSLIGTENLESADVATNLAGMSGLGEFNVTQLKKKLAGKIAGVQANLSEFSEGFSGSASPKDFETLLQLLYLKFEAPRFDEKVLDVQLAQWKDYLVNKKVDNGAALKDTLTLALTNHSDRTILFGEEFINSIDFSKAVEVYKDRFSDASDFTFVFVGNIDTKLHLPLIQKYIGNIKSTNRKETYVDHKIGPAKGKTSNIFERDMSVPKTTIRYSLQGEAKYTLKNRLMLGVISQLLSKRYQLTIREEEGGSYGVSVRSSFSQLPKPKFAINIGFDCDPEKRNRLIDIVNKEISKLQSEFCDLNDLNEIKNSFVKSREEAELTDGFWMRALTSNLMNGVKYTSKEEYQELVGSIDAKSIKSFAKKILKDMDTVEVIMNPKSN